MLEYTTESENLRRWICLVRAAHRIAR